MTQISLAPAPKSPLKTPLLCVCGGSHWVLTYAYRQVQSLGLSPAQITNPGTFKYYKMAWSKARDAALFLLLPFLASAVRRVWKQCCCLVLCIWNPNSKHVFIGVGRAQIQVIMADKLTISSLPQILQLVIASDRLVWLPLPLGQLTNLF